jgi:hypothetical protein
MESQEHVFAGFGLRKVLSTQLEKDPIGKEKFWNVEATIVKEDGVKQIHMFKHQAHLDAIQLFPPTGNLLQSWEDFKLAELCAKMDQQRIVELHDNIAAMVKKCQLSKSETHSWTLFLESIPNSCRMSTILNLSLCLSHNKCVATDNFSLNHCQLI